MKSIPLNGPVGKLALLDRDGVVNIDSGYIHRPDQVEWVEGAIEAIRLLNERGFDVVIVTNQSGIGRGYFSEEQYLALQNWMEQHLASQGAVIKKTFYCPHHPTEGIGKYRVDCVCKKPKPGMVESAFALGRYDRAASFLIGDMQRDVDAATAAGVDGYLFKGENLLRFVKEITQNRGEQDSIEGYG